MLSKLLSKAGDTLSDWIGYAATRVPLSRASGPDEVTLDLPGYCQLDSYGCGVVAGVMALKHFKPSASFSAFYARVNPHPEHGTPTSRLIGALQRSGLRVTERHGLTFADLCEAIDAGTPVIVVVHKHRRDAGDFDLAQLARASEGLTGSEIEQVFIEALYGAFDAEDEPNDLGIAGVLTEFVPLSKLMAEQITALRNWSKGRARPATSPAAPERRLRKLGV